MPVPCPSPFCGGTLAETPGGHTCSECQEFYPTRAAPAPRPTPTPRTPKAPRPQPGQPRAAPEPGPLSRAGVVPVVPTAKPAYSNNWPRGFQQHLDDTHARTDGPLGPNAAPARVEAKVRKDTPTMPEGGYWWFLWVVSDPSHSRRWVANIQGATPEEALANARAEFPNQEASWRPYAGTGTGNDELTYEFYFEVQQHARQPTDDLGPLKLVTGEEVYYRDGGHGRRGEVVAVNRHGAAVKTAVGVLRGVAASNVAKGQPVRDKAPVPPPKKGTPLASKGARRGVPNILALPTPAHKKRK